MNPRMINGILRRLQYVPGLRWLKSRVLDRNRFRHFIEEKIGHGNVMEQFKNCVSSNDYLVLSNAILGAHQLPKEILAFLDFAAAREPIRVAEIGTAMGGTNFLLCQALTTVRLMVGVDLFVANQRILHAFARSRQKFHFLSESSYAPSTVRRVSGLLAGQPLDLLFIDGDHTYEGARQDFARYRQFVRTGGLIAFHDIVPDYQTRFGKNTGRWAGDVPILWQELKKYYPTHEFIDDPEQDGLGIGVLEYDARIAIPAKLAN